MIYFRETFSKLITLFAIPRLIDYLRGSVLNLFPITIEIQPTTDCCLHCSHCSYKRRRQEKPAELPYQILVRLLQSMGRLGVYLCLISGGGEPCMYPYIDEVIMRAHNAGMKVGLITNGVMIKAIASVADLLSYIQVSIPAVRAEIYKHITGGSEEALRMVLDVPSKLRGERSSGKSHTIISSKVILTDENASHAVDILRQTGDSGFDNCYFRFVGDYENRGLCLSQQSRDILRKRFQENLDLCNDKRFTNLAQLLEPASPVGRTQHKRCWCLDLRIGANVDSSGEVYLCVRDIGKQQFSIGNVSMEAFPEIWNSDRHCSVIEMLQHRYASGRCNNCRYLLYNPVIEKIIELLPFKDGTPLSQSDVRIL